MDACHNGDGTRGNSDDIVRIVEDTLKVNSLNARGLYETFEMLKSLFMGDNDKEKIINSKAKPLATTCIYVKLMILEVKY